LHSALRRLGRYELISRIGSGGMAEVFLARQVGLMNFEKVVVVKTIHDHLAQQEEFITMLLDEAKLSAMIKHPCVVDIYDLGRVDDTFFIAMEYLAGQSMTQVLSAGRKAKKALDIWSTLRIIADAADGLHAAHNLKAMTGEFLELVHRDVSPGNIIVLYDGHVKLVDFGIAKARRRATVTAPLQIKGKLGYISPEQIRGGRIDRRSDIFSLGVVMWESLTYRRLFKPNTGAKTIDELREGERRPPSELRPNIPIAVDEICLKALADDPLARFQTAREMRNAIEGVLREANFYRETGGTVAYMNELFGDAHAEQKAQLRAALSGKGPEPMEVEIMEVDLDDEDYAAIAEGTPGGGNERER